MTEYIFKFPRIDAESIKVKAETFGEATDAAVGIRMAHCTPTRIDGEIYEPKASIVSPAGAVK